MLEGAVARFVCRLVTHHEGGDHLVFIGEIEHYDSMPGEPLVFHSGSYRIVTRHPEVEAGG
jgi:flavin reductase (DIM6/NTAB) family NADH-FMN oxidoreductase RutF